MSQNHRSILIFVTCVMILTVMPVLFYSKLTRLHSKIPFSGGKACSLSSEGSPVIRRIYQTWKSHSLPPRFQRYSATWKQCFPTWKYSLWNDTENRELIRVQFPWFLETYDTFEKNIHRADAVRYFHMYLFGGIYSDLDNECLKAFDDLLKNYSLVLGGMEGGCGAQMNNLCVQNSFFYSRPGHPIWMEVVHRMMQMVKKGEHKRRAEYVTGPIMMVAVFHEFLPTYPHLTWKVYPPEYFNPFSWSNNSHPIPSACKDLNRMSEEEYWKCRNYFIQRNTSYIIQYHIQTWLNGNTLRN
jgi:inositol phosphorylceramide mannosyltransferase catalytic subunit